MNGQRAVEILGSFANGQLSFTAQEIDELLKTKLVVEADPRTFAAMQWMDQAGIEGVDITATGAVPELEAKYAELDERLKSDWHRFTTTKKHLDEEEQTRRNIRRVLAHLKDTDEVARIAALRQTIVTELTSQTPYFKCAALGDELYAITARGRRVLAALAQRLDRYKDYPLAAFLKAHDKTEAKMQAFAGEIQTLSANIGYVKKNPHQVVIGLAKTGAPAKEALASYRHGMRATGAPDVAVTLARNAQKYGGGGAVSDRLQHAVGLLQRAGFPRAPETFGAAKTLLPFDPLEAGVERFNQIAALLMRNSATHSSQEWNVKMTARLMPADGTPEDLARRVVLAIQALRAWPSTVHQQHDDRMLAVAIASMVRSDDQIEILVPRERALEVALVKNGITPATQSDNDAIECVACPGTPAEVAATVRTLMLQIANQQGRAEPTRADAAIAVAFAKRFAY